MPMPMPIAPAQPSGTTAAASTQPSRRATTRNRRASDTREDDGRAMGPLANQAAPTVTAGLPPAIATQVSARQDAAVATRSEGPDEIAPVAPTAPRANERAGGSAPLQGPQRERSSLPLAVATFAALAAVSALAYYLLRARRAPPVAPSVEPARPAPANPELVATRISAVDTLHATLSATMPADGGAIDALAQTQVAGALGAASLRSRPGDSKTRTDFQPFSIGAYECVEQLGEGAMGIVYTARSAAHDRWCAVKVLVPDLADKPDAAAQFRREAKLASSVSHPNTVVVYDFGELDGGLLYLVMELLDGRTMDAVLRERALTSGEALELTRQLCAGLDALHAAGIIHQDLKPQNVMVSQRDGAGPVVKIVDFGLARLAGADPIESPSGQRRISGTPLYMAPEQARAEDAIGPGADLFSLAVVAYELLAGSAPFDVEGRTVSQVVLERASGHFHARSIATIVGDPRRASALDALFTEALAVEPERRPKSATEFYTRMNTALAA
jgi:serine/threonine-protein kinase